MTSDGNSSGGRSSPRTRETGPQRGLGGQLLSWAETAAVPLHRERYPDRPLSLSGFCLSHNAAAVALYAARGYHPVRWFHAMVRDLTTALPEVPAPPGVQITAFTPGQSETARLIRNEAFTDHRGSTEISAEGWAHYMAASAFRPAFSFLAYASDESGRGSPWTTPRSPSPSRCCRNSAAVTGL